MKTVTRNPAMHRAVRNLIERVPTLRADPRPEALQNAAKQLAAKGVPGAQLVARAKLETLAVTRSEVMADLFSAEKAAAKAPLSGAPLKAHEQTALVSGGAMSGMIAAIALAKSGQKVVVVEPHREHVRAYPFGSRQGMIDTLAMLDPKLARAFLKNAAKFEHYTLINANDGTVDRRRFPSTGPPMAELAPSTGRELYDSDQYGTIVAREFESLIEQYIKEKFPDRIQFVQGKLHAAPQPDGNVRWQVEKPAASKDAPKVYEDLLEGTRPSVVIVAEGANSATRAALGIDVAPTTPAQWWTPGLIHLRDDTVSGLGHASARQLVDEKPVPGHPNALPTQQGGMAVTDGTENRWTLMQMPPGYSADSKWSQQEINDYYFDRAALLWQTSADTLRAAGASGALGSNSPLTPFALQGKAAKEAARVLPDGTVVGLIGDAVQTASFQSGAGMNLSISEVVPVMTLMENLQTGMSPKEAAAKFERQVFEHGNTWSQGAVSYFYPTLPETKRQKLIHGELRAIAEWRKEGGATPLERLQKILEKDGIGDAPIGMSVV